MSDYEPAATHAEPPVQDGNFRPTSPPPVQPVWVAPPKKESSFKKGFGLGFGASLGFGVLLVVLSIISVISLIAMLGVILGASGTLNDNVKTSTTTYKTIWGEKSAKNTLRAIDISGTILVTGSDDLSLTKSTFGYEVANQIDEIGKNDAAGLILLMNTPGGTITGSRAISDAVQRYQKRTGHKVVAYVEGMSASGGMYSMAGADQIFADYGTMVGSIGVIMGPFNRFKDVTAITGNLLESGINTTGGITSEYLTAGRGKDFGNPFRDMTAEERANYLNGINVEYETFVNHVAAGRKMPADKIKNELGAFMFDPATAKAKGLIDDVMGRGEAFRQAATLNGVDPENTKVVKPTEPSLISQLLGAKSRVYGHTVELATGQKPNVDANPLCAGSNTVLAYSGDLAQLCKK